LRMEYEENTRRLKHPCNVSDYFSEDTRFRYLWHLAVWFSSRRAIGNIAGLCLFP
jgi:hypothetical protein